MTAVTESGRDYQFRKNKVRIKAQERNKTYIYLEEGRRHIGRKGKE